MSPKGIQLVKQLKRHNVKHEVILKQQIQNNLLLNDRVILKSPIEKALKIWGGKWKIFSRENSIN